MRAPDSEANAVYAELSLNAVQARLLYCLESKVVEDDINTTGKNDDQEMKRRWLSEWQKQIVRGFHYQDDDFFAAKETELLDYLMKSWRNYADNRWIYLVIMETALFRPYHPLGSEHDKAYKRLKFESEYPKYVFCQKLRIITEEKLNSIRKDYKKYYGIISGKSKNAALGIGITTLAIVLSGGLASFFAPQIAVLIAGEAVIGLHGAALTSAGLAFVGGGALAAGGGGMAAGVAIITGGGALLGAAGSGSAVLITMVTQTNPELWIRQGAKLATFCSAVLSGILRDYPGIKKIHKGAGDSLQAVEKMIAKIKEEETDLDKDVLKLLEQYKTYLERTEKEVQKVLIKY